MKTIFKKLKSNKGILFWEYALLVLLISTVGVTVAVNMGDTTETVAVNSTSCLEDNYYYSETQGKCIPMENADPGDPDAPIPDNPIINTNYKITWVADESISIPQFKQSFIVPGKTIGTIPTIEMTDNFVFVGWFDQKTSNFITTGEIVTSTTVPVEDTTYYAIYAKPDRIYRWATGTNCSTSYVDGTSYPYYAIKGTWVHNWTTTRECNCRGGNCGSQCAPNGALYGPCNCGLDRGYVIYYCTNTGYTCCSDHSKGPTNCYACKTGCKSYNPRVCDTCTDHHSETRNCWYAVNWTPFTSWEETGLTPAQIKAAEVRYVSVGGGSPTTVCGQLKKLQWMDGYVYTSSGRLIVVDSNGLAVSTVYNSDGSTTIRED